MADSTENQKKKYRPTQQVLHDISKQLSHKDVKGIQFLSNIHNISETGSKALKIFTKMQQQLKICDGNCTFLREILELIGHNALSNKLPDDTCSTKKQVHVDDIIKIHYNIAMQLNKDDIEGIKYLLEVQGQTKESIQDGIDLMLFIKKQNRISELVGLLEMKSIGRKDLASKLVSKEPPAPNFRMHSGELQSGEKPENTTVDLDVYQGVPQGDGNQHKHGPQGDGNQHQQAADTEQSEALLIDSAGRQIPYTGSLVDNKFQENKQSQTKQYDVLLLSTKNDISEVQEFKKEYLDDIRLTDGCQVKFCVFQEEGGQFEETLEKCSGVLLFLSRQFTTNEIMKRFTAIQVSVESRGDYFRTVYLDPQNMMSNLPHTISSIDPGFTLPLDGNHSDRLIQWIEILHRFRGDHASSNSQIDMLSEVLITNDGPSSSNTSIIDSTEGVEIDENDFKTLAPNDTNSGSANQPMPSTPFLQQEYWEQSQNGAETIRQYIHFSDDGKTPHPSKFIDKGRFGSVYKGIKNYLGYKVAVKVSSSGDIATQKQFEQEKDLAKLNHPFILPILNAEMDEDGKTFYIMYPYMDNKDLGKVMNLDDHKQQNTDTLLTQDICLRISAQIASAIAYLHTHCVSKSKSNIVHRDIKPGNILLDEKFNSRLSDAGLARSIPTNQSFYCPTDHVGTVGYLDPVFTKNLSINDTYRPLNDMFSFGVVMLQLITFRCAVLSDIESKDISEGSEKVSYLWQKYIIYSDNIEDQMDSIEQDHHKIWTSENMLKEFVSLTIGCLNETNRFSASKLHSELQILLNKFNIPSYGYFEKEEIRSRNCFVCLKRSTSMYLKSKCEDTHCSETFICNKCMSGWRSKNLFCPIHGHTEPPIGHSRCFAIVVSGTDEKIVVRDIFAHDANTVADVFKDPEIGGMRPENVHRIDATKENNLLKALEDTFKKVKKNSTDYTRDDTRLVFYYSGHAGFTGLDVNQNVPYAKLKRLLQDINANETLLVLDCCHAGTDVFSKTNDTENVYDALQQLKDFRNSVSKSGRPFYTCQLSSCLHDEESYAFTSDRISLFTKHFVEGLRGGSVCLSPEAENLVSCHVCKEHSQNAIGKGFTHLEEIFGYVVKHMKKGGENVQTPFQYCAKTEDLCLAWYPYSQKEKMYQIFITMIVTNDSNLKHDERIDRQLFPDDWQPDAVLAELFSIVKKTYRKTYRLLELRDGSRINSEVTKKELKTVSQINQSLRNGQTIVCILKVEWLFSASVCLPCGEKEDHKFKLQSLVEIKNLVLEKTDGNWPNGVEVKHLQIKDYDKELGTMDELKKAITKLRPKILCKLRDNIVDIFRGPVILDKFNKEDMDTIIEEVFGNKESADDSVSKGFHGRLKWCGRIITVAGTVQLNQFFSKTVEEFNKRRGLEAPIKNGSSAINDVVDGIISTAREAGEDAAQGLEQRPSFDIHVTDLGGAGIEIKSVRIQNEP